MKKAIGMAMIAAFSICSAVPAMAEEAKKEIIIYFDYSENIDTEDLEVDAVTQASIAEDDRVRERGNLLVMVDLLKEKTDADVYSIQIEETYAPNFMDMVDKAQADKDDDVQFTFKEELPDLTDVDTIYFGSPVWWYGMPQPVINYFERADLTGKELVFFSINRGSSNSGILEQIEEFQPGVNVVDEISISAMQDNDSAAEEFEEYLDTLMK